ncbi:CHL4 [Candida margitis]|uniref:CHL4 n=1 Tax=Candida margitis TaxID=1775924 RepID=UPI002227305B|nr:CHL4 [Candida margitis]KAI5969491.1 CHL4 [Candida margitis]
MEEDIRKENVLPNAFIPHYSTKCLFTTLERLNTDTLYQLCVRWTQSVNTQPHVPEESIYTQQGLGKKLVKEIKELRKNPRSQKSDIIRKIIYEYWPNGLNILQHAQLDCQLILDEPDQSSWLFSRITNAQGNAFCPDVDPQLFAQDMASKLADLYITHVYILKHPSLSMHIIRVQVFDLNHQAGVLDSTQPQFTSHKPYFVCLPNESSYIFHSVNSNDIAYDMIMQTIEQCLPEQEQNQLCLHTPSDQKQIASLETMFTLKGNSRVANSLGIWTPYADGTIDVPPLGALEKHSTLQQQVNDEKDDGSNAKLRKLANLRFQGNVEAPLKDGTESKNNNGSKKRKFTAIEDDVDTQEKKVKLSFASRTPLQYSEFIIQENIKQDQPESRSNIKLKFSGSDVFGGLHELAASTRDPNGMILNPAEIPNWLTGEEGATSGHIRDGKFHSN